MASAFPDLKTPIDFVFLKSRRRHTEQHQEAKTIVIDDGQGELLGLADAMVRGMPFPDDAATTLWLVAFAERFLAMGDPERALVCVSAARKHRRLLAAMRTSLQNFPGYTSTQLFLLLHEIAHFAVDTGQEFMGPMAGQVRDTLGAQVTANERIATRLESGEDLPDLDVSFGPGPSEKRTLMIRQIREYIELIRDHPQILREATCDVVALDGLMKLRVGSHYDEGTRRFHGITYREIADTMLLAIETCRLLVAQEFMKHTADAIAARDDPSILLAPFTHQTVRQDILTNTAYALFSGIVANGSFDTPFTPGDPASGMDPAMLFRGGIRSLQKRTVDRVLTPIERIETSHLEAEVYENAVRKAFKENFTVDTPTSDMIEDTARRLIAELPV